jgi:hypothetical protein
VSNGERLFRKKLVPVGVHQAPEGEVVVTPERVKGWVDKFNRLRSEGVRFPEPWGHQLKAIPHEDREARKFAAARWNAGYIERLEQDPKDQSLVMLGTIPPGYEVDAASGDLVNPRDGTRIGEVSAGIGDWRDGKGRTHSDMILHAALVPLPVWAGQDGFAQVALGTDAEVDSVLGSATFRHQLSTTTGAKMSDPKKKPPKDDPKASAGDDSSDALPVVGEEDEPTAADLPPLDGGGEAPQDASASGADAPLDPLTQTPTPDATAAVPTDPLTLTADQVKKAIGILGQMQFPLDADTTPANFMDRLVTGLLVLQKQGVTLMPKAPDAAAAPATVDTSTTGAQPEAPQAGMGGMGMMMSTKNGQTISLDPLSHKFATAAGERERQRLKDAWGAMKKDQPERFQLLCDDEIAALSTFTLSLDPDSGHVSLPAAVARLEGAQRFTEALGHTELVGVLKETLATAKVETNPSAPDPAKAEAELDKAAQVIYGDPNAKARRF